MKVLNRTMPDDIYEVYMRIKNDIKYEVIISESLHDKYLIMEPNNDSVTIKLNANEKNDDYFWEMFLHELIHIIQYQEKYKDLISLNNDMKNLCSYVNNVIMDIDVNRRLLNKYDFIRKSNTVENILINKIKKK